MEQERFQNGTGQAVITFEQVYKVFQKDWMALYDVSLQVARGEMVFLFGASGAGKTTLLSLVSMMQHPTQGAVSVLGHRSPRMKARHLPRLRRRLGVVFQDFKLLQDRTVYENVAFVLQLTGVPGRDIRNRVPEMLTRMGLETQRDKFPYQLSGGERQKVAIARALINEPEIILADEPTGNIGEDQALEILQYFKEINARGTTVLVATHNRRLVTGLRCRTVVLDKGRIKEDILPAAASPESPGGPSGTEQGRD